MDRCDDMATRPAKASGTAGCRHRRRRRTTRAARASRLAAAVLAVEAVGMCVAAGFSAVSTADGQSYQRASGIALTLIAVGTAVVFALFARGLAKASPWTRTPVVMTQLAIGVWAIYLLRDHRLEWGVPMLLVAACCLAALFTPASLRALNRPLQPRTAPGSGPKPVRLIPRWSGPRAAESGSWPAAGTRASGRCRARPRSGTGSCCRRTGAAGSSSPAAAAARAAA